MSSPCSHAAPLFVAALLGASLVACGKSQPASAEVTYARRCAPCHGPAGRGDGPGAAGLLPPPRSFHDEARRRAASPEHLAAVIREGGARHGLSPAMPAHGDLTPDEVRGLVDLLRRMGSAENQP